MARVAEVFVPGGLPRITYNPRESLQLEEKVRDYLEQRHKILSLSGPTKSGKTVLLRTVVSDAISISGGSVGSLEEFWAALVDHVGGYIDVESELSANEMTATERSGGLTAGLPGLLQGGGQRATGDQHSRGERDTRGRRRPAHLVAGDGLRASGTPLIIDDFHYMDSEVQVGVVRGLKDLVFDGVPVILASVPHRAYDAVRVEREMTGRVEQIPIEFWSRDELRGIAHAGLDALNVNGSNDIVERLIDEAFSSPHLMQEFCLQLCLINGIRHTQADATALEAPEWTPFFQARASAASKTAFELLAKGPRQRADRMQRVLVDGTETDIYGAVLAAIAATGPLTAIDYTQLRTSIREVLRTDPPQHHEVTRVLEKMSEIARERIEGEPVVDYDDERSTLFISDPFFAYYLRWGTDPPLAAVRMNGGPPV